MAAIMIKLTRRLEMPATMPISGGPARNPKKPILDTTASARPGEMFLDLHASLYTSGTMEETPKPTSRKPVTENKIVGNETAIPKPAAISKPLY